MIRRCDKPLCNNKTPKSLGPRSTLICVPPWSPPAKPLSPTAVCSLPRLTGVPKGLQPPRLFLRGKFNPILCSVVLPLPRLPGRAELTDTRADVGFIRRGHGAGKQRGWGGQQQAALQPFPKPYKWGPRPCEGTTTVWGDRCPFPTGARHDCATFSALGQPPPARAGRQGGPQLSLGEGRRGCPVARVTARQGRRPRAAVREAGRAACWRESARRRSPLPAGTPPAPLRAPFPPRASRPEPRSAARRSAARPGGPGRHCVPGAGRAERGPPGSTCRLPAPLPPPRTYHTEP